MASFRVYPIAFLFSTLIPDAVEASYCYYYYYDNYYTYYCSYYVPIGSIVGAVIGSLVGLATLIGLIVFFCCIRSRRMAARGTVLQPGVTTFATTTTTGVSTVQMGGGYVNTAAYPPGTTPAYPQYTYPPQHQAPSTGPQPPPSYS